MADRNTLIQDYKDSHPGASDEEAIQGLLSLIPSASSNLGNLNFPAANNTQSNYDINSSDSTTTLNGNQPTMAAPATPPVTPPIELSKEMPLPPVESPAPVAPMAPAKQPVAPKAPVSDIAQALETPNLSSDNARREAMLAENEKAKKRNILPLALAGAGDAISNASASFGGHPGESALNKVVDMQSKQEEERKKGFEDQLKNDPQSDISKAYRQMVLKIAPDLAGNTNFENMSAMAIGDKLPLIDTMMKASAAKDTREMSLAALKESRAANQQQKDVALSEKEDQFNQRRWERFGAAVNPMNAGSRKALGVAAINNMRADRLLTTASNKELTSQDYAAMIADLQGIYKGGVPDQEMMRHGDYTSIQRSAGQLLGKITSSPQAINTPEVRDHLVRLTRELKDVDNKAINDNLGFNRVIFDELEKSDPAKFQKAMEALGTMTVAVNDQAPGAKEPLGTPKTSLPTPTQNKPTSDPLGLF